MRDSVGVDYSELRILLLAIPILSRLCLTRELIQAIIGSTIDLINQRTYLHPHSIPLQKHIFANPLLYNPY